MFGFFRKKTAEKSEAYRLGREAGAAVGAAIDGFFDTRGATLKANFLGVLATRLKTITDGSGTPLELGRIEYDILIENWNEHLPDIAHEAGLHLREWLPVVEELKGRDEFEQIIADRLDALTAAVSVEALSMTAEAIDRAKGDEDDAARSAV